MAELQDFFLGLRDLILLAIENWVWVIWFLVVAAIGFFITDQKQKIIGFHARYPKAARPWWRQKK